MIRSEVIVRKLEGLSDKLAERGQPDLAREIDSVVEDLRKDTETSTSREVMTTGEAASLLGVRSVFTIKRWAREGILDGFRRGGRILVTRESVERVLHSPNVAQERRLEADLAAFDGGDQPVPSTSWSGRKPWETHAPAQP
jgi:excisionase family DNA binding protein